MNAWIRPFGFLSVVALVAVVASASLFASETESKKVKDFTLKAINKDHTFKLSEVEDKYVALHFLLKTDCPICIRYTTEYFEHEKKHPDVLNVFIKPDSAEEIEQWVSYMDGDIHPPIYRDADAKLAKQLKVKHGYEFHGEVVHYPAFILIDKEGKEVFRYTGKNTGDRFFYEKFKEKAEDMITS